MPNDRTHFRGKRLFLSIDLPDYLKERLSQLKEDCKGFHWVRPELMHITLKFIGDMPGQFQSKIEEAIDPIEVQSFMIPIEGLGVFPHMGKPHAIWVGVKNGHPHLYQLQKKIEDALFSIGIEPERRIYVPHITLARVSNASPETVRQYLKRNAEFATAPMKIESFDLLRSEEIEGIRHYAHEKTWALTSPQTNL